jgi:tetratricopeptide (TPR) repeat protein
LRGVDILGSYGVEVSTSVEGASNVRHFLGLSRFSTSLNFRRIPTISGQTIFGRLFAQLRENKELVLSASIIMRSQKAKLKKEMTMKTVYFLAGVALTILIAGCATIQGSGDVDQGRQALLEGNYKRALGLFQDAEKVDPKYLYGTELREGVSSFLGRTQYLTGNYTQARQTLEKALSRHKSDNVARLYLGLTLYRLGDQKAALTNMQRGMQGIYNFLQYINTNFRYEFGKDWDDAGTIRADIKSNLAMISSDKIDWPQLVAGGERVGLAIEREEEIFRDEFARRGA